MTLAMIDEHALPEFRATRLSPDHVLRVLPDRESGVCRVAGLGDVGLRRRALV